MPVAIRVYTSKSFFDILIAGVDRVSSPSVGPFPSFRPMLFGCSQRANAKNSTESLLGNHKDRGAKPPIILQLSLARLCRTHSFPTTFFGRQAQINRISLHFPPPLSLECFKIVAKIVIIYRLMDSNGSLCRLFKLHRSEILRAPISH